MKTGVGGEEHLTNNWPFAAVSEATLGDLNVDFSFTSHLLDHAANGMFHKAASHMMSAFESREHLLHTTGVCCTASVDRGHACFAQAGRGRVVSR
jgi:ribosome-associated toxin RatA of RatAB toxin-antitoxin module